MGWLVPVLRALTVVRVLVGMTGRVCEVIVLLRSRLLLPLPLLWLRGMSVRKATQEQEPVSKRYIAGRGLCSEVGCR